MVPATVTDQLKAEAMRLGFDLAETCPAAAPGSLDHFRRWLADGHAGRMYYMVKRAGAYAHPRHVLDGVQSILMLGVNYRSVEPALPGPAQGKISRYAWGDDYHDLIRDRLHQLADFHRRLTPGVSVRGVVDTAPLLEKDFAQQAGLGWIGKNTLLLNKRFGSRLFLAGLLTTERLDFDRPNPAAGSCGSCRACLDACPTGALIEPYRLDSRRCISYLTIELRDSIDRSFRDGLDGRLFGCDACQDVCPWNRATPVTTHQAFHPKPETNPVDLVDLFRLDESGFRARFRRTPLWRPLRCGLLRNAAIALGARRDDRGLPGLLHGLGDAEPLVRSACAWALGRSEHPSARAALQTRLSIETHDAVKREIEHALR
jgi:epoxyqueuosine reductase